MHIVQTVDVHWQPKQNVFPVNALLGNGEQLFQERKKNRLNKRSMDKNQVRLRKIPLGTFIDALLELYNEGLDFIDIVGTNDAIQDTIGIMFTEEYMSEEMRKTYGDATDEMLDEIEKKFSKDIDLSNDDDLNQII